MLKEILLCSNINCKCLSINIQSANITEKVGNSFIKPSADSTFLLLDIGSKMKTRNWRKVLYNMFFYNLRFPNFKQR